MATSLPLYLDKRLPIEGERPLPLDHDCRRCSLGNNARNVCLPAAGEAGGVLLVGDWPTKYEDSSGEPFTSRSGKYVRNIVNGLWDGPVAVDYAVRCVPGKKPPDVAVDRCRPYLTKTIQDVHPERIIALGAKAAHSIFGQAVPVLDLHHGIGWLYNDAGKPIPVFILMGPVASLSNTFLGKRFEADMKWALTCDIDKQWKPPWDGEIQTIETIMDADDAVSECYEAGGFTYDIETVGRVADKYFEIISLSVTPYGTDDAWVWDDASMKDKRLTKRLFLALADAMLPKTGTNLKYDHQGVQEVGDIIVRGTDCDALLQRKLLYSDVSGKLEHMAYMIGMGGHKMEMANALIKAQKAITKARKTSQKAQFLPGIVSPIIMEASKTTLHTKTYAYGLVPKKLLLRYNGLDSITTERMRRWLAPQMEAQPCIQGVWKKIVNRGVEAVTQMERWGMPVDRGSVERYDTFLSGRLVNLEKVFKKHGTSPTSGPQMQKLLYDKFQLPVLLRTATGEASTDAGVLTRLIGTNHVRGLSANDLRKAKVVVQALLDHRAISKLRGTYADGMLDHIRDDRRIHPSLNLAGASSGRTSCSKPNLQNIPRDSNEIAGMARSCFIADPGRRILQLDYSQLEYRIAAMMSEDPVMLDMFYRGEDFHTATAQLIARDFFGCAPEDITKEMRSQAKTFNFGLLYGMGDATLAKNMGCTVEKARELRFKIMGKWVQMARWMEERIKETRRTGYAWTWWDGERARRRPLWRIGNTNDNEAASKAKNTAKNSAGNTPIQGTASDFCIMSLIECIEWLQGTPAIDAKLIISVHDSLMFDVAEDDLEEVAETAHDIMLSHNCNGVPLVVDIEQGVSWGSLEKMEL